MDKNKFFTLVLLLLVFFVPLFGINIVEASEPSLFEKVFKGFLDVLFPLSAPYYAPPQNCAALGGYCSVIYSCNSGYYHNEDLDSTCVDVDEICCFPLNGNDCVDEDGDGYNVTGGECGPIDCDDSDETVYYMQDFYVDEDGDGYGFGDVASSICWGDEGYHLTPILGHSFNNLDCNDTNVSINPEAVEICDNIDNNCNNLVDENLICDCYQNSDCEDDNECTNNDCQSDINGSSCFFIPVDDGTPCGDSGVCTGGVCEEECVDGTTMNCGSEGCEGKKTCVRGVWSDCDSVGKNPEACSVCDEEGNKIYDSTYVDLCDSYCGGIGNFYRYYETCSAVGECSGRYESENCASYINETTYCNLTTGNIERYTDAWSCSPLECVHEGDSVSLIEDCAPSCLDTNFGVRAVDYCKNEGDTSCDVNYFSNQCGGEGNSLIIEYGCDGSQYFTQTSNCSLNDFFLCSFNEELLIEYSNLYSCDDSQGGDSLQCNLDLIFETGNEDICGPSNECMSNNLDCGNEEYICYFSNSGFYMWKNIDLALISESSCNDGRDNDCDGFVDCDDEDCSLDPICQSPDLDEFTYTFSSEGWTSFSIPLVNLVNTDPNIFEADILLTYDGGNGWLINYGPINQILNLESAKAYFAYYSLENIPAESINLYGNFDNQYSYSLELNSWALIGIMREDSISNIYSDPSFTVLRADLSESLVDVSSEVLSMGEAYWVYPGEPLESPPSFNLWDYLLNLFGFR